MVEIPWKKTRRTPARLFGVDVTIPEIRAYEKAREDLMSRLGGTSCLSKLNEVSRELNEEETALGKLERAARDITEGLYEFIGKVIPPCLAGLSPGLEEWALETATNKELRKAKPHIWDATICPVVPSEVAEGTEEVA